MRSMASSVGTNLKESRSQHHHKPRVLISIRLFRSFTLNSFVRLLVYSLSSSIMFFSIGYFRFYYFLSSFARSFVRSSARAFVHSFVPSHVCSFVRSHVRLFLRSFTRTDFRSF